MTLVTNSNTIYTMTLNLIDYLTDNITDPNSTNRSADSAITNDNAFVKIKDGKTSQYLPQIVVELPGGGRPTPTGILNWLRNPSFVVWMHSKSQIQAVKLADEVWDNLRKDIGDVFHNSKMFPPTNHLSDIAYIKHENKIGEWYAKMTITFQYFHYGA